jgi:hypothetical protein
MLEGLFSTLNPTVPPVPSLKNQREPLQPAPLLTVPPVPSVPPEKSKAKTENTKTTTPAAEQKTNPAITCKTCIHFESHHAHGGGSGECRAGVMPFGACWWADTVHQCERYLSRAPKPPVSEPDTDPLLITVYTPSGTPMTTRARDAEHAEWLRKMNPKPENPAPKPTTAEHDTGRISEGEHNAQGRYFKFLATWADGRQCYLCQMPRMTLAGMQAQYPDATYIEPVLNEDYPHD